MADKPKTPTAQTEAITERDLTLNLNDATTIVSALEVLNSTHLTASLQHQAEIDNPSLMNPRIDYHTQERDRYVASIETNNQLIHLFADTFEIETGPLLQVVIAAPSGVTGPAEENRPPSANAGPASSNQI